MQHDSDLNRRVKARLQGAFQAPPVASPGPSRPHTLLSDLKAVSALFKTPAPEPLPPVTTGSARDNDADPTTDEMYPGNPKCDSCSTTMATLRTSPGKSGVSCSNTDCDARGEPIVLSHADFAKRWPSRNATVTAEALLLAEVMADTAVAPCPRDKTPMGKILLVGGSKALYCAKCRVVTPIEPLA